MAHYSSTDRRAPRKEFIKPNPVKSNDRTGGRTAEQFARNQANVKARDDKLKLEAAKTAAQATIQDKTKTSGGDSPAASTSNAAGDKPGTIQTIKDKMAEDVASGKFGEGAAAGEPPEIIAGVNPLGLVAPAGLSMVQRALTKGNEFRISHFTKAGGQAGIQNVIAKDKAIQGIANTAGVSIRSAGNIYARINNTPVQRMLAMLGSPGKVITGGAATIMGADALYTWFGADNIASAQPFFLRNVRNDLRDGNIDQSQANELVEGSQNQMDISTNFINTSTRFNPLLWPFRNILMTGLEGKQTELDLIKQEIEILELTAQNLAAGEEEQPVEETQI